MKYLNSVPLAWGILEGPQAGQFESFLHTPAECADQLRAGNVDVGLIPSIEFQRIPECRIVPGPAVISQQRVRSVLLIALKPLSEVRTVAADTSSRTSIALARIIFREFYHTKPEFRPTPPDLKAMLATNDAAVLIGDAALKFMEENDLARVENQTGLVRDGGGPLQVFDMAERWRLLTGLPFVFAFWAARKGFNDQAAVQALIDSREYGVARIPEIARRYAELLSLKEESLQKYLTSNVHYYMDKKCVESLRLFYEMAKRAGEIKSARPVEFL